jgi:ATP-dependent Lon protease
VNKFLFYIFVLLSFLTFSQEGKSVDIKVDSISKIEVKHFSKNLKEKYTDEAFIYNYKFNPNNLSVWEKFKHWITQKFKDWFNIVDEKKASKFTRFFLRTMYVIVFLAVLFFIIKAILNDEGNWVFGRSNKKLDINAKVLKEELLETNFKELIQNAVENKDYRLAIRYYYLSVLKALTKKQIIEWDNEKTNYDYLKEIKDNKLREQFEYISYIYDYCWYGEFQLDEKSFSKAEQKFNQLL